MKLYFRMLQGLGVIFGLMGVCTSPIAFFSWYGNFLPDMGQALAKTTIGNLGIIAPLGVPQDHRLVVIGCQGIDIKQLTGVFGYLNTLALVLFMVYCYVFRLRILPKAILQAEQTHVSMADFSVEIDKLPAEIEDQASYEKALELHVINVLGACRARNPDAVP